MKDPKGKTSSRVQNRKEHGKKEHMARPEEAISAEGGFMLETSEILDFAEGTDSTP